MRAESPIALRVLVTVTFNPNQLRAHLEPLLDMPEVEEVVLVADEQAPTMKKLRCVVPPRPLVRILGRAGAKLVMCVFLALRDRPDWVVGFNLIPHGINAIAAARIARRKSMYHMIGGAREWDGGGWDSDNALLRRLTRPSPTLEALLMFVVRRASVIAVMGEGGRTALIDRGVDSARVHCIPASVDPARFPVRETNDPLAYDVLTVGALIGTKGLDDFLRCVALTARRVPGLRAAVVGTGPLEESLRALAVELEIDSLVSFLGFREDTPALLQRSKVFMLTSKYEGLSVAVCEAMTSGLPVIVSDVGELGSIVQEGVNGFLCPVGRPDLFAERLVTLLEDESLRTRQGQRAATDARSAFQPAAISERYRAALRATKSRD